MVNYQKKDFVAIMTLEKGDLRNAIDVQLIEEVKDIKRKISIDHDIRILVITGNEAFSLGTERHERALFEEKAWSIRNLSISSVIGQFDQPTIAAISGDAFGQGLEFVLACDLRMCTETARFAMNQVAYGDIPWDGGTQRLSRVVGRGKAMEMILTGDIIDAFEAHRIGLVHRVVSEAELVPAAMDMAREIAMRSPTAVRYAKEAINKGMDVTLEQGLRLEADLYFLLHTTRDRIEGIEAFQEKRSPNFEGR